MQLTSVKSTTLAAVGYEEAQQLLVLEFRNGDIYHYFDVPAAVQQALMKAPSKGTYFNAFIRDHYPYLRKRQGEMKLEALSSGRG